MNINTAPAPIVDLGPLRLALRDALQALEDAGQAPGSGGVELNSDVAVVLDPESGQWQLVMEDPHSGGRRCPARTVDDRPLTCVWTISETGNIVCANCGQPHPED